MPDSLLSVREAADLLGVHVDTVRRWTDSGRLPDTRTPGGHRRIPRAAVDRIRRGAGAGTGSGPTTASLPDAGAPADQAWARHALVHARYELDSQPAGDWRRALSEADRQRSRENGRHLVGLLLQHVAGTLDDGALWSEVDRVTRDYAALLRDAGMPYSTALRAALFFRDVLSESTAFYPPDGDQGGVALLRKVNAFTNAVQLAIAEAYAVGGPVDGPRGDA